jgi:hypothetical protein
MTMKKPHHSLACTATTVETDNIDSTFASWSHLSGRELLFEIRMGKNEELDQRWSTAHGKEAAYACTFLFFFGQDEGIVKKPERCAWTWSGLEHAGC